MLTIKNSIECAYGIPVKQQRFIFKGKVLGDLITVENAGLDEDSVIHMVFSLVGGYQFLPKKESATLMPHKRVGLNMTRVGSNVQSSTSIKYERHT